MEESKDLKVVNIILNTLIDIVGVDKVGECIKTFTELK